MRQIGKAAVEEHRHDKAEPHRQGNARHGDDHRAHADIAQLLDIGFKSGLKHDEDDADLGEKADSVQRGRVEDGLPGDVANQAHEKPRYKQTDHGRQIELGTCLCQ